MMIDDVRERDGKGRAWSKLAKLTGLALGIALFGITGLSGTLAQEGDATAGTANADALVESIIANIFAEIFGGEAGGDAASTGGDINVGGNSGGNVTMGGSMGGGITIGGSSGGSGVNVGDQSGG